jgi:hypothetical protein
MLNLLAYSANFLQVLDGDDGSVIRCRSLQKCCIGNSLCPDHLQTE